jgi:hypothetical protein
MIIADKFIIGDTCRPVAAVASPFAQICSLDLKLFYFESVALSPPLKI